MSHKEVRPEVMHTPWCHAAVAKATDGQKPLHCVVNSSSYTNPKSFRAGCMACLLCMPLGPARLSQLATPSLLSWTLRGLAACTHCLPPTLNAHLSLQLSMTSGTILSLARMTAVSLIRSGRQRIVVVAAAVVVVW